MAPIPKEWKGTLRFVAGTAASLLTAFRVERALPRVESSFIKLTQAASAYKTALVAVEGEIGTLTASGKAIPAELLKKQQTLTRELEKLTGTLDKLRNIGGDRLTAAEKAYNDAVGNLQELQAKANSQGAVPSFRDALQRHTAMRAAKSAVRKAYKAVARIHDEIEIAAIEQGVLGFTSKGLLPKNAANVLGSAPVAAGKFPRLSQSAKLWFENRMNSIDPKILQLGYNNTGLKLAKKLDDRDLLTLSRYWNSEVVQHELVNGEVWLGRGTKGTIPKLDHITDVRQISRMTHTRPGEARLDMSLGGAGNDFDSLVRPGHSDPSRSGLNAGSLLQNNTPFAFEYRIIGSRSVIWRGKDYIRPISITYNTNHLRQIWNAQNKTQLVEQIAQSEILGWDAYFQQLGYGYVPIP